MAIIALSVFRNDGNLLLSRQFTEIGRNKLEGYLGEFFKMKNTSGLEHSYIETSDIRYIYQPIGDVYAVLLTTTDSNIFEDFETIRNAARLVTEFGGTAKDISSEKGFHLLYAFDEIISLGYPETSDLHFVKRCVSMHSENEVLAQQTLKNQEKEAKEIAKRKEKEIKIAQNAALRHNSSVQSKGIFNRNFNYRIQTIYSNIKDSFNITDSVSSKLSPSHMTSSNQSTNSDSSINQKGRNTHTNIDTSEFKSLSLNKPKEPCVSIFENDNKSFLLDDVNRKLIPDDQNQNKEISDSNVKLLFSENLIVKINRSSQLEQFELNGVLTIFVNDPIYDRCSILFDKLPEFPFNLQVHPNMDRDNFSKNKTLSIKENGKNYPVNGNSVSILKWNKNMIETPELIPLEINSWVDKINNKSCTILIEAEISNYEIALYDLYFSFLIGNSDYKVVNISSGNFKKNAEGLFIWNIGFFDKDSENPSLEILLYNLDSIDSIYPIKCQFKSRDIYFDAPISEISANNSTKPKFNIEKLLVTEKFFIT